jgi:hypothetical protein
MCSIMYIHTQLHMPVHYLSSSNKKLKRSSRSRHFVVEYVTKTLTEFTYFLKIFYHT